jgi:small-conductance mechanosensitive channel
MKEIGGKVFLSNTVLEWAIAAGVLIISFIIIRVFKSIIISRLQKWAATTESKLDDFLLATIEKSAVPLFYIMGVYFSINMLSLSAKIEKTIYVSYLISVTFFLLRITTSLFKQFVHSFIQKQENSETKEKQAKGLLVIVNVIIWVVGGIFLINNLGYNVTTLIAGLGIGGIAIALAAQTILADLFSYFVIFFDRPFELGDYIVVDDKRGTVEYVGIKTTRIKALTGEQIICSNNFLTNAKVHNFKRMEERRIVFNFGVTYQTSHEKLSMIPGLVKDIIEANTDTIYSRGHFSGFGDSSLNFEFVYFVKSPDYAVYMDVQQSIYLGIVKEFELKKIDFAYPTQTLYVQSLNKN